MMALLPLGAEGKNEGASYSYVLPTFFKDVHHHAALPEKNGKTKQIPKCPILYVKE
jgi:hypothetical protein